MKIPDELLPDIDPDCPLSTRFAVDMYTGDFSKIPDLEYDDPEYVQKAYLAWLDHRVETNILHCDLSDFESQLALGLHAIGWLMVSNHINQDVSIYDIYVAMCDFEKKQREFKDIHENGFLIAGDTS
jgi:hypothetical protein